MEYASSSALKSSRPTMCNDSLYQSSSKVNNQTRRTILKDGDFMLQGILPFTYNCDVRKVRQLGLMQMIVMQFSIEEANKLLPEFKIGYQFDDGCLNIPSVMSRGIEIVSLYRPDSACRTQYLNCRYEGETVNVKPIAAVIGTVSSFTSIPLASLLGLYEIPLISFGASSRLLSKKEYYKSFFRTMPSDEYQVAAMIDILKKYKWNYIFAVGSDDNYGKLAISTLKKLAAKNNICVAQDEYISYQTDKTKEQARQIAEKLRNSTHTKVVVLFTYTVQGALIMKETNKMSVKKMWLTSDAWYPSGVGLVNKHNVKKDDLIGILTVSSHRGYIPKLKEYINKTLFKNYHCNAWFQDYLKQSYGCVPQKENMWGLDCKNMTIDAILNRLLPDYDGKLANLIDAVKAITLAIKSVLKEQCHYGNGTFFNKTSCIPLEPSQLTKHLFKVEFKSVLNEKIKFNKDGDPEFSSYFIDNIQKDAITGKLKFVKVGKWTNGKQNGTLDLSETIVWPQASAKPPKSRCSEDCKPGEVMSAKTECCWTCRKCAKNTISTVINSDNCNPCGNGYHANAEHTMCIKTPIVYLNQNDPGGISIITFSCIGFVSTIAILVMFIMNRHSVVITTSAPNLIFFSLILLVVAFLYGASHIGKPTVSSCCGKTAYFYMLFITYVSVLFVKTKFISEFLGKFQEYVKIEVPGLQLISIAILIFVQLIIMIVWLIIDPVNVSRLRLPDDQGHQKILLQCNVDFNTCRLIATSFPCFILLIAAVAAFRERHDEHPFNEPKFVSFASIAVCIVVVAFLPTFKYVVGIYRAIVIAFTVDVCGCIFIGCLFVPKLYIMLSQGNEVELTSFEHKDNVAHELTPMTEEEANKQTVSDNEYNRVHKTPKLNVTQDTSSSSSANVTHQHSSMPNNNGVHGQSEETRTTSLV